MNFASKFVENTVPILNKIKDMGHKVYVRSTRKFDDGCVPESIWIPGLPTEMFKELTDSLYHYDSEDHETVETAVYTSEYITSKGWVEL